MQIRHCFLKWSVAKMRGGGVITQQIFKNTMLKGHSPKKKNVGLGYGPIQPL